MTTSTPASRRRVTFLGDALCESALLQAHATTCGHDFRPVFAPLRDYLAASDYVVANLETPISPDDTDLTHERWCFNSPRAFAEALQWAGVDFVTTANNYCLDRGTAGIAATIGALDDIGLPHTGTFATHEASATPAIADVGGFRLGLLSYTYGTNAFSNHEYLRPGEEFMVNLFQEQELAEPLVRAWYADRNSPEGRAYAEMERNRWPENLTLPIYERVAPHDVQRARFAADVARMRAAGPDFVALGMHTGGQYNPAATKWTKELAAFAQSCGVDFVVGNHEHTIHGGDFSHLGEGKLTTYCLGEKGKGEHWFVGNYPSVTYAEQANYLIRAYLLARSFGVESMMQYDFSDDGRRRNYTEHNFGMVFQNLTPKPSYAAIAIMTHLLGEATPLGRNFGSDNKTHRIVGFDLPDGHRAYAAWAVEEPVSVPLPEDLDGKAIAMRDIYGNPIGLESPDRLAITESPIYVIGSF